MQEFVKLQREYERKRSLTSIQRFTIMMAGVLLVLFLSLVTLFLGGLGLLFGTAFVPVVSMVAILQMIENMRNKNISDFLSLHENDHV